MPALYRVAIFQALLLLLLAGRSAFAARVVKISNNPRYILISVDNPGEWPRGTRVCAARRGDWVDCGSITRANSTTAIVQLDSQGGRVQVGDLIRAYAAFAGPARRLASSENYPRHELVLGTAGLLSLGSQATAAQITLNAGTTFQMSAFYNYAVAPFLQLGINPSVSYLSQGTTSTTIFQLLAGPTLAIPWGSDAIYNSVLVSAMGGLVTGGGVTAGAFSGELGVRVRLVEHASYRPTAGVLVLFGDASQTLLIIRPLAFSILF